MKHGWVVAVVLALVSGCSDESTTSSNASGSGDGGSPATGQDGASSSTTDTPPVPTAGPGEIAVTIRDQGKDTTFHCKAGASGATSYAKYATNNVPQPSGTVTVSTLLVRCSEGTDAKNMKGVAIGVSHKSFPAGSYDLATTYIDGAATTVEGNSVQISLVENGAGILADFNGNGGVTNTGTLTLDDTGSGGSVRGSATAAWQRTGVVVNGAVNKVEERAGSLAIAFNWPTT
jgi:hypothetical protein